MSMKITELTELSELIKKGRSFAHHVEQNVRAAARGIWLGYSRSVRVVAVVPAFVPVVVDLANVVASVQAARVVAHSVEVIDCALTRLVI